MQHVRRERDKQPSLGFEREADVLGIELVEQSIERQRPAAEALGNRITHPVEEDHHRNSAGAREVGGVLSFVTVAMPPEEVTLAIDQELERLGTGERDSILLRDLGHDRLQAALHQLHRLRSDLGPVRAPRRAVDPVRPFVHSDGSRARRSRLHRGAQARGRLGVEERATDEKSQRREEVGVRHRGSNAIEHEYVGDNGPVTPRWKPDADVVSQRLDDEVVLINLRTNRMFSLNRTGARAWELLQTGHDWSATRSALLYEFDVNPATLDRELEALSASLAVEGFAPGRNSAPGVPRPVTRESSSDGKAHRAGIAATASLVIRMGAWSLVLPALKHLVPLPRLVRLMARDPRGVRSPDRERLIERVAGRIYRQRQQGTCLERSLVVYRYLTGTDAGPQLVIGVRREDRAVIGHAWVLVQGSPLYESSAALESFVPVVAFGPDAAATTTVDRLPRP